MDRQKIFDLVAARKPIEQWELKVVYYARVSTDKTEQALSLENQSSHFRQIIADNPNWSFAGEYIDEGISGTSVKYRKNFLKMIEHAKNGMFDLILTKEISRFSRNTLDSISYTRELYSHGVGVYFEQDNINTLERDSELRLTIMASIAQDEVRRISDRVKFGFERSIKQKRVLGSNMLGYDKTGGSLKINEAEAELVRYIFACYNTGNFGIRSLAAHLNEKGYLGKSGSELTFSTIKGILTNPKYKGVYCGKKYLKPDYTSHEKLRRKKNDWVEFDDSVPAIVSKEVWQSANDLLELRSIKHATQTPTTQRYSYSAKIFCQEHSSAYHRILRKNKKGDVEVWQCSQYRKYGKKSCSSPSIKTRDIDALLLKTFEVLFSEKETIASKLTSVYKSYNSSPSTGNEEKLKSQLEKIEEKKEALLDLYMSGALGKQEFKTRNDALNLQAKDIENEISDIEKEAKSNENARQSLKKLKAEIMQILDAPHLHEGLYSHMLKKLVVGKDSAELYLSTGGKHVISLCEIGISQAQVSRIEKSAISHIRKSYL